MTERKLMTVRISINDPGQDWIVGRVNGMIDAIAFEGRAFYEPIGYAVGRHRVYDNNNKAIHELYTLCADVSSEEFNRIFTMLDRSYGDKKLFDYTVECDW